MAVKEKISLPRADYPEQVGVSSKEILAFIKDAEESNIEVHSIMVLRHGKVAFETWRDPYGPEIPHTIYSISKSFTSVAAGFAIEEGYFELDTKVIDIFPEFRPEKEDPYLEEMTIRHLLTMTSGKDVSLLDDKSKNKWKEDFFKSKWYNEPGKEWKYISENTYMVCAAIKRITGMSVIDFLTPRLFDPLGYDRRPFWETDIDGVEAGGWGLYLTTEEIAKFIYCVHNGGRFNGKQVIPEHWVKEATKKQVESLRYHELDNRAGYGYFFWRNGIVPNSFRADGMFSQFGVCFDDYDAEFIITSCEITEQKTRDLIWRHFPAAFIDEKDDSDYNEIKDKLFFPALPELP
ncbi:MAG: beta-lactamase family protein, partial [Clostridiales bacterium]|nr:beta-lactamase family protein [Clostridiales bacterium]